MDYKRHKLFAYLSCGLLPLLVLSLTMVMPTLHLILGISDKLSWTPIFSMNFMHALRYLEGLQFIFACSIMRLRFKALNDSIDCSTVFVKLAVTKSREVHNTQFVKLFHNLCDSIETINDNMTFHFIPIFCYLLVRLI